MANRILETIEICKSAYKKCMETFVPVQGDDNWKEKYDKARKESGVDDVELKDDEYISEGYTFFDTEGEGRWVFSIQKKPLKPMLDTWETDKQKLSWEDWKELEDHNITGNGDLEFGFADRDEDILIIRTPKHTWRSLCGREWYYNIKTKELKLKKMS